jgi:septal ring factor EnvC (AmiA/AmiB activator)
MVDKLQQFFSENEFDFKTPNSGHLERFEGRLKTPKQHKKASWKWLGAAASVVLIFGFWLGSKHQKRAFDLADISPKMEEAQNYFRSTIQQEIKTLEKNRSLETEKIIEIALDELEELEDNYKNFVRELSRNDKQRRAISAMIKNYQRRLTILEITLEQIDRIKNLNIPENEIYI